MNRRIQEVRERNAAALRAQTAMQQVREAEMERRM